MHSNAPRRSAALVATLGCVVSVLVLTAEPVAAAHADSELVSVRSDEGQGNSGSYSPSVSRDGRFVAFPSDASNLVPGDTNGTGDIFVRDRLLGTTERVSVDSGGGEGNGYSFLPRISGNGRYVAFGSEASDLVAGDTEGVNDVFVHDRQTGVTERVSVDSAGTEADLASPPSNGDGPMISNDGRYVAFASAATNLVTGDLNGKSDTFLHDRDTGATERVSVSPTEVEGTDDVCSTILGPNAPSISDDGRFVAFCTNGLLTPGDNGNPGTIYVRDRQAGDTELISAQPDGFPGGSSLQPAMSTDGRYVAFISGNPRLSTTFPDDAGSSFGPTLYVRDRETDTTIIGSKRNDGVISNGFNGGVAMSPDGRRVAWATDATLESPGNGKVDVFVRDLDLGQTHWLSRPVTGDGTNHSINAALTSHPGFAAFLAYGDDVGSGDANGQIDVIAHYGFDLTPPVITPVITGTLGDNGWYTSDVGVTWTVTDAESSVISSSGCGAQSVTADTTAAGITFTCRAMSAAQPTASSVTIKRDATEPTIGHTVVLADPDGESGWYVSAPTVTFTCGDASPGSGLASCVAGAGPGASRTLGQSASAQSVPGTATDQAGNSASDSSGDLKVDLANPTITNTVAPASPNGTNGWYTSAPTVTFSCGDSASGVDSCLANGEAGASKTLGESAAAQSVSGTATDVAGRTGTSSRTGLKVDLSNPTLACSTPTPSFLLGEAGAQVRATVADAVSGPASTTATAAANTSALGLFTANVTGTDLAGRSTTVSCGYAVIHARTLSVSDVTLLEGNAGTTTANFTVTLSSRPPTGQTATVQVKTTAGTAGAGSDYTQLAPTTLTWTAAATAPLTRTVSVPVIGDVLKEGNESFTLDLSAPTRATVVDASGRATIVDEEGPFSASVNNPSVTEGSSGTRLMTFTVSLGAAPAAGQTVTVKVKTANGTAVAPGDYTAVPLTTLNFGTGQSTRTVSVTVRGDSANEPNETVKLDLSAPSAGVVIADAQGLGTIVKDEGGLGATPKIISIGDISVLEGSASTTNATFAVTLTARPATGQTVKVKVTTADGSAKAPGDFTALPLTTLTWTSTGPLTKSVVVPVAGDTLREGNETFSLSLSAPTGGAVLDSDATGTATIIDEEGLISARVDNVAIAEGNSGTKNVTFKVSLSAAPATGQTASVRVATADGTAIAPGDYAARSLTVNFAAGQLTKNVTVTIQSETAIEGHETFFLNLTTPSPNVFVADAQATATIVSDD